MRVRPLAARDAEGVDALVVLIASGAGAPALLPRGLRAKVDRLIRGAGPLRPGAVLTQLGERPARIVLAGLGPREGLSRARVHHAAAAGVRALWGSPARRAAIAVDDAALDALGDEAIAAAAEGALHSAWRPEAHRTRGDGVPQLTTVGLIARAVPARALRRGVVLGEAANFARRLANEPANLMTPSDVAVEASALADATGLRFEALDEERCRTLGMHAYLSVAQGSDQPPRFIVLRWHGRGEDGTYDLALVGKGITFDSGGISIKPAAHMHEMKADMAGAAIVIAAVGAVARLGAKRNVIAIAPCAENVIGPRATKPGDVFTSLSGRTVEVIDTDAEGRLALIDGVAYAQQQGARRVVDVATLTTGAHVALGGHYAALLGTPDEFVERVRRAAAKAGDPVWPLPLSDEFRDEIRSDIADVKNSAGRYGGASKAAAFIEAALRPGTEWAHLDIAGMEWIDRDRPWSPKGPQAPVLRTLVGLALEAGG